MELYEENSVLGPLQFRLLHTIDKDALCNGRWDSRYCVPTPCIRAEKSRVSRTVSSPLWRSFWLTYIAVFWGTNSSCVCPLKVTDPFTCKSWQSTCLLTNIQVLLISLLSGLILRSLSFMSHSSNVAMDSPSSCYQAFQRVSVAVLSFLNSADPIARSFYSIEINGFSDSLDHREGASIQEEEIGLRKYSPARLNDTTHVVQNS